MAGLHSYFLYEALDVSLVTIYYLVLGFGVSLVLNHILEWFDEDPAKYKKFSTLRLGVEILLHIVILALVFYVLRRMVKVIPFPWDGAKGYNHDTLYEVDGGIVLVIVILFFQRMLIEKVGIFQNRIRELLGYNDVPVE